VCFKVIRVPSIKGRNLVNIIGSLKFGAKDTSMKRTPDYKVTGRPIKSLVVLNYTPR
jgi:hypothetical protein